MVDKKYLFAALGVITGFIFITTMTAIYVQNNFSVTRSCGCEVPMYLILLAFASLGLFAGSITYYFHSKAISKERVNLEKKVKKTLNFLDNEDKKIVRTLTDNDMTQSELAKNTSISTVKLHRRLKDLELRGIVKRKKNGMSKTVSLHDDFKDLFD